MRVGTTTGRRRDGGGAQPVAGDGLARNVTVLAAAGVVTPRRRPLEPERVADALLTRLAEWVPVPSWLVTTTDEHGDLRSMASRGHLGGLSWATPQAVIVLDAAGMTAGFQQLPQDITALAVVDGKLAVGLATGQVVASVLQNSTMGNARVENCVVQAVRRWEFPKPLGGGIVIVTYPFAFTPVCEEEARDLQENREAFESAETDVVLVSFVFGSRLPAHGLLVRLLRLVAAGRHREPERAGLRGGRQRR